MRARLRLAPALLLGAAACGGASTPPAPASEGIPDAAATPCTAPADVTLRNAREVWPTLTSTCLLAPASNAVTARGEGLRYELRAPLFSDYTDKERMVVLPPGAAAEYRPEGALAFPVGTVLVKTFSYGGVAGEPRRALETRLLVHTRTGWIGLPYVWEARYHVPSANQCAKCHEQRGRLEPLGPTAENMQVAGISPLPAWAAAGHVTGMPASPPPLLPAWDDASAAPVAARARAWLDANCAYCHSRAGTASPSGLYLGAHETDPGHFGVCKSPVAAGKGTGGRRYAIVPGRPDESILLYRLEATSPDEAMPELGRSVVHAESVALVRAWIEGLEGDCATPSP